MNPGAMPRRAVLLFVKDPAPGRVKTRLAATVGPERAAEIYRQLAETVFRRLPDDCAVLVAGDPPARLPEIAAWLRGLGRPGEPAFFPQAPGDLGARLVAAFAEAFARGFDAVAAIGSDCVELGPEHFAEAWAALATQEVAIGPAADGGYYLLALRAPQPTLFRDIAWSTDAVCRQTLDRAAMAGLSVHRLPTLRDVDTEEDLRKLTVEC